MAKRRRTTNTKAKVTTVADTRVEKSGSGVLNNAGGTPPRDAQPSPEWERLKKRKKQVHEPGALVVEPHGMWLTCRCWEPWVNGHSYKCPLWKKVCDECGFHNGLHRWDCRWWDQHAGATPFDHHKKPMGG